MPEVVLETLKLVVAGDPAAFEQVYKAMSGFVYNVALRITRNNADAQEVTQDVFLKLYHSLKDFQFRSAFKTWVYRITVNTAINRYRRSARELKNRVANDLLIESLPGTSSASASLTQSDHEARLNDLLSKLSPEHRVCLILREIEGLSYQEIAAALKIPMNTVRSRLKRGRQALIEEGRKGEQIL